MCNLSSLVNYQNRDPNDKSSSKLSHKLLNDSSNSGDSTDDESFEEGTSERTNSSNELNNPIVSSANTTTTAAAAAAAAAVAINPTGNASGVDLLHLTSLGSIGVSSNSIDTLGSSVYTNIGSQSALSAVTSMSSAIGYPGNFRFGPHHTAAGAQSHHPHFGQAGVHSLHSTSGHTHHPHPHSHLADVAPSALVMHHAGAAATPAETMFQLSAAAAAAAVANPSAFDTYSKYNASMAAAVAAFSGARPNF